MAGRPKKSSAARCGALAMAIIACGPTIDEDEPDEAKMLGIWSSRFPDPSLDPWTDLSYLYIDDDGTMTKRSAKCGFDARTVDAKYTWTLAASDAIEVTDEDGSPMDDAEEPRYLVFHSACDQFQGLEAIYLVDRPDNHDPRVSEGVWHRGDVCMRNADPSGACELSWCDGERPVAPPCN